MNVQNFRYINIPDIFPVHIFHISHRFPNQCACIDWDDFQTLLFIAGLILRSHTTGEFHGSHTGSILPSQFQKTIVKKLSVRCGSKNYEICLDILDCVQNSICKKSHDNMLKKSFRNHCAKSFFTEKIIFLSIFYIFN